MNPSANSARRRPRALVIDDDDFVRATVASMLEAAGYDVHQAQDGDSGLMLFEEHRPELVVTDVLMPNKEGIETILELRQRNAEVRIIAMTGGGEIGATPILDVARKLGADDVLHKPFSRNDLLLKARPIRLVK